MSQHSRTDSWAKFRHNSHEQAITKTIRHSYRVQNGNSTTITLITKKSPFFGKENLFAWTCDPVKIKTISSPQKVVKEPKAYKSQPLLTPEDFTSKEEMANFYKTNGSTLKRLKDVMDAKQLDHSEVREEALSVLKKWREL